MIFDAFHAKMAANTAYRYAEAADALHIAPKGADESEKAEALLQELHNWKCKLGLDQLKLADYGFVTDQIDEMVRMTHWVGGGPLTRDRYRLTDDDLAEILENSLNSH